MDASFENRLSLFAEVCTDRDFVVALGRGLIVLEAFSASGEIWCSVGRISKLTKLPKPTVDRLLKTLAQLNILNYSPSRRAYSLTAQTLGLGFASMGHMGIDRRVRHFIQSIADDHAVHVSIVDRDYLDVVYLCVAHSQNSSVTLRIEKGERQTVLGFAAGHAILASYEEPEFEYYVELIEQKLGPLTSAQHRQLRRHRLEITTNGYVLTEDPYNKGLMNVAAPLMSPDGFRTYAVSCSFPRAFVPESKFRQIGEDLSCKCQVFNWNEQTG